MNSRWWALVPVFTVWAFFANGNFAGIGLCAQMQATAAGAPANDNFNDAIALSGAGVTVTGSNLNATKEGSPPFPPPGEPNHADEVGGASVWWTWTAPGDGLTTIDTFGSDFDTLLAVYTGTAAWPNPSTLAVVASNDDGDGGLWSRVQFMAVAGTVYHIAVDGYGYISGPSEGNVVLNIQSQAAVSGVALTSPTNGSQVLALIPLPVTATASSANGTVSRVEFFADGTKFGEATTSPYTTSWANPPLGAHVLTAVMTDSLNSSVTSAPVNITAMAQPAGWVAFNDPGTVGNPNDTSYTIPGLGTSTGPLVDITNGWALLVVLTVTNSGLDDAAADLTIPAAGTPAYTNFTPFISWGESVYLYATNTVGCLFSGLDPARTYSFMGTAVRGGTPNSSDYSNRWTQVELAGAVSATPAHSAGVITAAQYPAYLSGNQVAWNVGYNHTPESGDVVSWTDIRPAPDGTFTVLCTKYAGLEPNGNGSTGLRAYAFAAIRLGITPFGIGLQPQSLTVTPGDTAAFTVSAFGSSPLFYQWLKNGTNIDGATNQSYAILDADLSDQGDYSVLVSNLTSSVLSSNATLLVGFYPITITSQPSDQSVNEGAPVALTVGVNGAGPYYFQWFKDGAPIAGATNQSLALASATSADMALYFVLVSDRFSSAVSREAVLTVFSPSAPGFTLLRFTDGWRYDQSGADLGTVWKDPAFSDEAWPLRQGVFANSPFPIPQPVSTALSLTNAAGLSITSYYFRTHFTFPLPTTNVFLLASNLLDDGAVYYLNGVELARLRIAPGSVTYVTTAAGSPGNGTNYDVLLLPSGALLEGDNLLAVEVHQAQPSIDVVFGLSLKAMGQNSELARITLSPASQTIAEGQSLLFNSEVFGTPPFSFQWYKDGQLLPGATNQNLLLGSVHGPDEGIYTLVAANRFNAVQSSGARLTVVRDLTPPSVVSVLANDPATVVVIFSEPVDPATALNPANYAFSPALTVTGVQLLNSMTVLVTTTPRDPQWDYTLAVGGVQDFAVPPNVMTANAPVQLHRRNQRTTGGLSGIQTVFFIIFENQDWWGVIKGSPTAPYLNSLLFEASWCGNYHAYHNQHPSQPSYIRLEAGTDFGYSSDAGPSLNRISSTNHLTTLLRTAGIEWRGYMESLPYGNTGTNAVIGEYVGRHNPFAFFDDVTTHYDYCTNHVRPYSEFAGDLAAGRIGRYNFITPNLTNDMHDLAPGSSSAVRQGDTWLAQELPRILNSAAFSNNGAVFITWDESLGSTLNPIGMTILSPLARGGGYQSTNYYDHHSTLRTMQDIFGVYPYLGLAASATNWSELFLNPRITPTRINGLTLVTLSDLPAGKINYLQASSNLVQWTTISILGADLPNETITVSDPDPGHHAQRFYRIVEAP